MISQKKVAIAGLILLFTGRAHALTIASGKADLARGTETVVYERQNDGRYKIVSKTDEGSVVLNGSVTGQADAAQMLKQMSGGVFEKGTRIAATEKSASVEELNKNKTVKVEPLSNGQIAISVVALIVEKDLNLEARSESRYVLTVTSGSIEELNGGGKMTAVVAKNSIQKTLTENYNSESAAASQALSKLAGLVYEAAGYPGKLSIKSSSKLLKAPKSISCQFEGRKITCVTAPQQIRTELGANWALF